MNGGFKRERTSNNNDATKKRKISCLNMNEDDIFEEFIKQLDE